MRIRNLLLLGAGLAMVAAPVYADLNYTEGSGKVIFDFICFTTKHCSAHTPINSAGTEIFTSATPGQVTGANGTFPASQSGTWTVQPGNTANTTAWKVDGSAVTQPVSAASLPLPTGGSTSANQTSELTKLDTIITNTGAPIPAGTALVGKVGIDQTTPGTTNGVQLPTTTNGGAATVKGGVGVVNGGSTYQAVAASQTATVLQTSTGAIGDYLSHCDIYPTSTSPGVVTVFDNTNAAAGSVILFPGGASSVSNLVPFAVPVGAVSTAGAWKVTTGAAVSVVCYGKFS